MNKKIFTLYINLLIVSTLSLNAQVSGVSASKLSAYNASSIGQRAFEFEPAFFAVWSSQTWDKERQHQSKYENNDSLDMFLESGLRFTYGISDRIEIGALLPLDFTAISFGSKINFLKTEGIGLSGLVGLNFPKAGKAISRKNHSIECVPQLSGGLAFSSQLNEKISIDANGQIQTALKPTLEKHRYDLFLTVDGGYYLMPGIQAVAEISYAHSLFSGTNENTDLFILNLGFTIETARNFILVANSPLPLMGKNNDIQHGFGFALTIMLD